MDKDLATHRAHKRNIEELEASQVMDTITTTINEELVRAEAQEKDMLEDSKQ